ncbi:MAG: hypothetical protein ACOC15_01820 [Desulfovibrionales bacterium]
MQAHSERSWQQSKPFQLVTFVLLNARILKGVWHSKRLRPFLVKYKVSYLTPDPSPNAIRTTRKPPQVGDRLELVGSTYEVTAVTQVTPPRGEFCFLQAVCREVKG